MAEIVIKSNRLKAEILEPGTEYRRQRFDWTGIVSQIELDGKHHFLAREPEIFGQIGDGRGLSSCFEAANGFEYMAALTGEYVPRVGVGMVERNDRSPFSIFHKTDIKPAKMSYQAGENEVTFTVEPMECNGYAYLLNKTLRVSENRLETIYELKNVGEKSLVLDEFNHNYTMLDDYEINGDYEFSVPYNIKVSPQRGEFSVGYRTVRVNSFDHFFSFGVEGFEGYQRHSWTIRHRPTDISYRETLMAPAVKLFVWGCSTNFCPETYVRIRAVPGQTVSWTRIMEFFGAGENECRENRRMKEGGV